MYICCINQFWLALAQAWSISAIRLSFHVRQALLPVLTPSKMKHANHDPMYYHLIIEKTVSDPYVYSLCKYFGP